MFTSTVHLQPLRRRRFDLSWIACRDVSFSLLLVDIVRGEIIVFFADAFEIIHFYVAAFTVSLKRTTEHFGATQFTSFAVPLLKGFVCGKRRRSLHRTFMSRPPTHARFHCVCRAANGSHKATRHTDILH